MTASSAPPERRGEARAPIELRVEYRRLNMFFADYTRNISKGGSFIHTDRPLPIGTEFVFSLVVPTFEAPISLVGKVMWIVTAEEADASKPAGMGIEFQYRDGEERSQIDGLVKQAMVDELGADLTNQLLSR